MPGGACRRLREALTHRNGPRVAVVGGSLGGLTAGLVLRDAGCDVDVHERSRSALEGRGAGIAVLDATVRYFVERGGGNPSHLMSSTEWIRFLHSDGSTRFELEHRYRFSSWNTIYRGLMAHFDAERYHLGREVTGFDDCGDEVEVRFADGRSERVDLLVCADGISSAARARLLPEVSPRYAGYVAWRGTIPEGTLSPDAYDALWNAITYQLLPNSHILAYPIPGPHDELEPGKRVINFVWYRNVDAGDALDDLLTDRSGARRVVSLPPGAVQDKHVDELRRAADDLAPVIREVVVSPPEPFLQVIFDIEVPRMAFGRVCLIGDAAFALRPHAAAGTAKAAADAWALGEAMVDSGGDVAEALRRWEPPQLALGRQVVARTREIGDRSQFLGTFTPGDPILIFGLYEPGR